ncbi:lysosomal alpha-glucosidase [Trichonephila inaurata madagascariensis]|uniref:Lysosomal alpha-glucosidase n=1 Tax=Trichonephila inaurata madagascariensis TaxID=2747483 RepID=A0A8X6XB62_9ARAC|nr:lysosomal alpha-glucosidase [Trichonephila inaurata madagascariensis]
MKGHTNDDIFYLIKEERQKSRISVLWLILLIGIALCFLSFATLYHFRYSRPPLITIEIKSDYSPVCTGIADLDKFDCHPDDNVSKQSCLQRNCCYQPKAKNFPPLNIPYCYYPSNYNGYVIGNISQDGRHIRADLKRSSPSGFPKDVVSLHLVISFIDDYTLRIKITDAKAARFEVPIPINDALKNLEKPYYDVKIDSKTGELIISRKSSGVVIFKTSLSQLVYSDQFLQITSKLPSPYIYGIGEHYGSFLKSVNWTRLTLLNSDRGPLANYPLYGSHPFYLSLENDGSANGVFLLNSNAMDVILQPTPAITFRPIGGILDFFIMLGPSPANVVQQFTGLVGRTFMPPYWSLGFHLCRYGYGSLNKTIETMQRNLDAGIPLDVQWNDIDYMDNNKDFTYDKENFAGLPEFVDDLHSKGMHYVIMTDPGISCSEKPGTYPPYDDGLKDDIFVKNPDGTVFRGKVWTDGETVYPDFSHPKTASYWQKLFADFHGKIKYDGVWIDMNEPSNFYDGGKDGCMKSSFEDPPYLPNGNLPLRHKTLCMTAKHYSTIHYNEHNLVAYREAAATNQALKSIRQKRPFIISRASYSGQGAQSGHWSGDIASTWEDLRYTIPSMLDFNLFGMSMIGSDICGFSRNTTVPLCARWQALGAFYPFSRNHNDRGSTEQDPAFLGPVVVEAAQKALEIRYTLLPYLYTLFARSHVFGDTVIRPLFFEFPLDKNTYGIDEQFMWGPAMMIVPGLYENATNVSAYIPKGIWFDSRGILVNSTGERISFPLGLTDIYISVRGGYILPGQLPNKNTELSRKEPFMITATLDENSQAKGELYWDDGDSLDTYVKGNYTLIRFNVDKNTFTSTIVNKGYDGPMDIAETQIAGLTMKPSAVSVNGVNCPFSPAENDEQETNLFIPKKLIEKLGKGVSRDPFCVYGFKRNILGVGMNGFTLLSPLTINWK